MNAALLLHVAGASDAEVHAYLERWALLTPELAAHVIRFLRANSSPAARTTLTGLFARWEARIAATLALAQERGDLARGRDVHELAAAVLEAWEGAAMRGKVQRDRTPYERFARITLTRLLGDIDNKTTGRL